MDLALSARLETVEVDEPVEAGGLQVFALRWRPGEPLNYRTLDDGLAAGLLEVTEVTGGGSVPTLKVTNKGDAPAFLMAGEQLSGGKQNRVLNASILVAPHSELPIPVSCVERGRWAYRSAEFRQRRQLVAQPAAQNDARPRYHELPRLRQTGLAAGRSLAGSGPQNGGNGFALRHDGPAEDV